MAAAEGDTIMGNGAKAARRSIGELTKAVSRDASDLVRAELEAAKMEMAEKAKQSAAGAGMIGAALLLATAATGALTATAILALALVLDAWLSALIVAVVLLMIAVVLVKLGANRLQAGVPPVPHKTVESAKEDVQWLKQRATSGPK